MKTINIKGKEYVTVNERLKEFRNLFKDYSIVTEIIEHGEDYALMKASVIDDKGVTRATGYAREVVAKSPINKFAFIENCETSAIGRALGNFGIGIDEAVCTADELLMKLSQEKQDKPEKPAFEKEAAAEKTARTKALKAGDDAPAPKQSLDERFQSAKKYIQDNMYKDFTKGVYDRINLIIDDLVAAGRGDDAGELQDLMTKKIGLDEEKDFLDAFIDGTAELKDMRV